MPDPSLRPYVHLFIGIFLTGLGLASSLSGEAVGSFGRIATRVEEPKQFRTLVVAAYLGGAFNIAYILYEKYLAH